MWQRAGVRSGYGGKITGGDSNISARRRIKKKKKKRKKKRGFNKGEGKRHARRKGKPSNKIKEDPHNKERISSIAEGISEAIDGRVFVQIGKSVW